MWRSIRYSGYTGGYNITSALVTGHVAGYESR